MCTLKVSGKRNNTKTALQKYSVLCIYFLHELVINLLSVCSYSSFLLLAVRAVLHAVLQHAWQPPGTLLLSQSSALPG